MWLMSDLYLKNEAYAVCRVLVPLRGLCWIFALVNWWDPFSTRQLSLSSGDDLSACMSRQLRCCPLSADEMHFRLKNSAFQVGTTCALYKLWKVFFYSYHVGSIGHDWEDEVSSLLFTSSSLKLLEYVGGFSSFPQYYFVLFSFSTCSRFYVKTQKNV